MGFDTAKLIEEFGDQVAERVWSGIQQRLEETMQGMRGIVAKATGELLSAANEMRTTNSRDRVSARDPDDQQQMRCMKEVAQEEPEHQQRDHAAATKLQAWERGKQDRRKVQEMVHSARCEADDAATTIQKCFRSLLARKKCGAISWPSLISQLRYRSKAWSAVFDEAGNGQPYLDCSSFWRGFHSINPTLSQRQVQAVYDGCLEWTETSNGVDLSGFVSVVEASLISDRAIAEYADMSVKAFIALGDVDNPQAPRNSDVESEDDPNSASYWRKQRPECARIFDEVVHDGAASLGEEQFHVAMKRARGRMSTTHVKALWTGYCKQTGGNVMPLEDFCNCIQAGERQRVARCNSVLRSVGIGEGPLSEASFVSALKQVRNDIAEDQAIAIWRGHKGDGIDEKDFMAIVEAEVADLPLQDVNGRICSRNGTKEMLLTEDTQGKSSSQHCSNSEEVSGAVYWRRERPDLVRIFEDNGEICLSKEQFVTSMSKVHARLSSEQVNRLWVGHCTKDRSRTGIDLVDFCHCAQAGERDDASLADFAAVSLEEFQALDNRHCKGESDLWRQERPDIACLLDEAAGNGAICLEEAQFAAAMSQAHPRLSKRQICVIWTGYVNDIRRDSMSGEDFRQCVEAGDDSDYALAEIADMCFNEFVKLAGIDWRTSRPDISSLFDESLVGGRDHSGAASLRQTEFEVALSLAHARLCQEQLSAIWEGFTKCTGRNEANLEDFCQIVRAGEHCDEALAEFADMSTEEFQALGFSSSPQETAWRQERPDLVTLFDAELGSGANKLSDQQFVAAMSKVHPRLRNVQVEAIWQGYLEGYLEGPSQMSLDHFCQCVVAGETGDDVLAEFADMAVDEFQRLKAHREFEAGASSTYWRTVRPDLTRLFDESLVTDAVCAGPTEFAVALRTALPSLSSAQVDAMWKGYTSCTKRSDINLEDFCHCAQAGEYGDALLADFADMTTTAFRKLRPLRDSQNDMNCPAFWMKARPDFAGVFYWALGTSGSFGERQFHTAMLRAHPRLNADQVSVLWSGYVQCTARCAMGLEDFCRLAQAGEVGDHALAEFADVCVEEFQADSRKDMGVRSKLSAKKATKL
jgi:hypothetical protein